MPKRETELDIELGESTHAAISDQADNRAVVVASADARVVAEPVSAADVAKKTKKLAVDPKVVERTEQDNGLVGINGVDEAVAPFEQDASDSQVELESPENEVGPAKLPETVLPPKAVRTALRPGLRIGLR